MAILALASFVSLCLLIIALIRIFYKLWWAPNRLQRMMRSQGISGPPYRFIHGSTKEIMRLQQQAMSKPLSGLSHDVFPKVQPHIHLWTNLYGKNYLQWHGSQAQLVITEPELIKEIFIDRDKLFPKPNPDEVVRKLLGDGVGSSGGEKWAKMRKLANHAFQAENLKGMFPSMTASAEAMIARWKIHEAGKEIDVYEEFSLFTSEVISRTAFGSSYLEGKTIFEMLERLTLLVSRNMLKQYWIPGISKIFKSRDQLELDELEKGIHKSIKEIIKRRKDKVRSGYEDGYGSDLLGLLLKAHHEADEKQRISVDEMVDECKTFYFAGQETTNSFLAWIVFLLAVHTDWQDKARKEVLDLFEKQTPNPDGISKLNSMNMIINETLRLYSPAISVPKKVERDMKLGVLNLPANLLLQIPIYAVHHDPGIWGEDVHLFKPERFSEGIARATKGNFAAFLPFSMGARNCVGSNFAISETKIALAMILQHYTFTLSPTYVHSPLLHITNRPQYGVQVILNPA